MKLRRSEYTIIALLLFTAGHARAQKWYTPDVARELGLEPCGGCSLNHIGNEIRPIRTGSGRISAVTMAYFDTTATYAQGRVVDLYTGIPIKNAFVQTAYTCWEGCDVKAAYTNEAGFFRLGWVGCHGLKGWRSNRPLLIQAAGYHEISTEAVGFGASTYLHIELAVRPKRR